MTVSLPRTCEKMKKRNDFNSINRKDASESFLFLLYSMSTLILLVITSERDEGGLIDKERKQ